MVPNVSVYQDQGHEQDLAVTGDRVGKNQSYGLRAGNPVASGGSKVNVYGPRSAKKTSEGTKIDCQDYIACLNEFNNNKKK